MIRLYDTMAREKREFVPADHKRITMYVCGPTVYGRAHIGNARPAVVFDTLRRLLEHQFPDCEVIYARNVTDVDDKIIASAAEEGVDPSVITERYERFYLEDMGALGVVPPTIAPHATEEIPAMVAMIGELIAKNHAYEAEGHVLFSVASDADYGALSRRDREAMIAGARVEVAPYKRDPADFVLWKPSERGVIGWDSPWGRGRPGWHIECSAMIRAHLGETIDIHGGGLDLIFPHHENEIAQSRCAHGGKPLANYWVHNGFVDMGAEKMSKSLGNVVTIDQLLGAGHKGEVLRLALLSAHYRSPLPWTAGRISSSAQSFEVWKRRFGDAFGNNHEANEAVAHPSSADASAIDGLRDDLNVAEFFKAIHRLADEATHGQSAIARADAARALDSSLRLIGIEVGKAYLATFEDVLDELLIDQRIADRVAAKSNRDFATADRIRDELKAEGVLLEDGPSGTTWRRA
ncbi:cysteine--tRNA ligase [Sphingomonas sp.]|uniref:cysteine--tRNA ligase n=1 Tax=Sphingomonas sp. TaxID=28214 RepID=UPI0025E5C003|nr:cysteine--tRNA ligase [Sphingomonas sp.]